MPEPIYPKMVSMTVTSRCNLRCVMCYHAITKVKKEDFEDAYLDKLKPNFEHASTIDLTGLGEPLFSKQFWKIIDLFKVDDESPDEDFKVVFNCNGTLFDDENVDGLLKSGIRKIRVSIDSADARTFEAIRDVPLKTVVAGARRLIHERNARRRKYPLVGVQMTLMKSTVGGLIDMVDLCKDIGADFVEVWSLNELPESEAADWNVRLFNYNDQLLSNLDRAVLDERMEAFHAYAHERRLPAMSMVLGQSRWGEGFPGDDWGQSSGVEWTESSIRCELPWQVQRVHYGGEIYACCWGTSPIGHLADQSSQDVWNGETMTTMRSDLLQGRIPKQCSGAGCPYVLGKTSEAAARSADV